MITCTTAFIMAIYFTDPSVTIPVTGGEMRCAEDEADARRMLNLLKTEAAKNPKKKLEIRATLWRRNPGGGTEKTCELR